MVLSAEGDLAVRPRREPRIGDEVVSIGHIQAGASKQLVLSFGLDGTLPPMMVWMQSVGLTYL